MNKTEFNNLFDDCLTIVAEKYPEYNVRYLKMVLKVNVTKRLVKALGKCCYATDTLTFNARYIDAAVSAEEVDSVKDTILHELAHYVDHNAHSHNYEWEKIALNLGAVPKSSKSISHFSKTVYKYTLICPFCGAKSHADRKGVNVACSRCCDLYSYGYYNSRYLFEWHDNDTNRPTSTIPKKPIKWTLSANLDDKKKIFYAISRSELFELAKKAGISSKEIRKNMVKVES